MALGANNSLNQFENPGINTDVVVPNEAGVKTAGTTNSGMIINTSGVGAIITAIASAVAGTLSLQLQWSPDGGTTWLNYGPATGTIAAAGQISIYVYPTNASQTAGATPANLTLGSSASIVLNGMLPKTIRVQYIVVTTSATITGLYINYSN